MNFSKYAKLWNHFHKSIVELFHLTYRILLGHLLLLILLPHPRKWLSYFPIHNCVILCVDVCFHVSWIDTWMELLSNSINLYLMFGEIAKWLSSIVVFLTRNVWGFLFLPIFANIFIVYLFFLTRAILVGVEWYYIAFLIHISLMQCWSCTYWPFICFL